MLELEGSKRWLSASQTGFVLVLCWDGLHESIQLHVWAMILCCCFRIVHYKGIFQELCCTGFITANDCTLLPNIQQICICQQIPLL